jgi:hypothetical protein
MRTEMVLIGLAYGYARRRRPPIKITATLTAFGCEGQRLLMSIFLSRLKAPDYRRGDRRSQLVVAEYVSNTEE